MLSYFSNKKAAKKVKDDEVEKPKSTTTKDESTRSKRSSRISSPPSKANRRSHTESRKSHTESRSRSGAQVLDREDEKFLERLTSNRPPSSDSDDDGPPLPPRIKTPEISFDSDASSFESRQRQEKGEGGVSVADRLAEEAEQKPNRFSFVTNLSRNMSLMRKKPAPGETGLKPSATAPVSKSEAEREETEVSEVLDNIDLAADKNNKTFSLSKESGEMVKNFTQVFKDLVNGVPTAYDDLIRLIEDRDGAINRGYEKLPSGLKKLVAQLPEQMTSKLAPELLAVAAEAQGLTAEESAKAAAGGLGGAAKSFLTPKNMKDLVTKPGALVSILKGIVNALKTRWPAFMGTNVLWSVALFILLSMLWYCYKRGREVRLEREAAEAQGPPIDGSSRIEELPDDPALPAPRSSGGSGRDKHRSSRPPSSRHNSGSSSGDYRRRRRHSGYGDDDYHHSERRRGSHSGHASSSAGASSSERERRRRSEKSSREKDEDYERRRRSRREEEKLREQDEDYERRRRSRREEERSREKEDEDYERRRRSRREEERSREKEDEDHERRRRRRDEDRKSSSKAGGSSRRK